MRLLRSERAATITEVAFILPVFILFLMVIMEGGRVLSVWMVLTNSTRETARYVIAGHQQSDAQGGCTNGDVIDWTCVQTALKNQAQNYEQALVGNMINPTPLVVTPTFNTDAVGTVAAVTITSSYTVNTLTPIIQNIVPTFNISTAATMRTET